MSEDNMVERKEMSGMGRIAKSDSKLDDEMKGLIERAAEGYARRMHDGEKIGIQDIIEDVMSAIMKKEREFFLMENRDEANGFYSRTLQLAIGKLNLKIPRIRMGNNFRPALLPSKWKRVDKDYENLLLALLTNGYSQMQIDREGPSYPEPALFTGKNRRTFSPHKGEVRSLQDKSFTTHPLFSIHRCLPCKDEK